MGEFCSQFPKVGLGRAALIQQLAAPIGSEHDFLLHVLIGTIMLLVILGRSLAGHFTLAKHFGFQGVSWTWHFVDVLWLLLLVFVYWL